MTSPPIRLNPSSSNRLSIALWSAMGTFQAIAYLLHIRLLLMLAVGGSFWLAYSLPHDGYYIYALLAFSISTILPLTWLDHTTRRRTPN